MLLLFKTMVEMFGYPGRERRDFIEDYKEVMAEDEYNTAVRWLCVGTSILESFLINLDPKGDK